LLKPLAPELEGGRRPRPRDNPDFYLTLGKILYEDYRGCYRKGEIAARYGFRSPHHLDIYIERARSYAEERREREASASLPQPMAGAEEEEEAEITGRRLMKALEPVIVRYFGKEADRLTAEYISNIFAVGAQFEVKYAPWCLQVGGMDRISCVTKALDFYIKYRDVMSKYEAAIEELSARYAAALKLIVALVAQEPAYITPVIKAKILKSVLRELARGSKIDFRAVERALELRDYAT